MPLTPSRAIVAIAVGQTVVWAGLFYIFPALILVWEADLGLSRTALTLTFSLALGIAAAASPLAGRFVDRGRGPAMLAGSALFGAAALAILSATGSAMGFAAVWALIGFAMAGCLYEPTLALVVRTRGEAARRSITVVTLIAGFASTVSFPLAGWLAEVRGWRTAAVVFALMIACVGAPLLWAGARALERNAVVPAKPETPPRSAREIASRRGFLPLAFAFGAIALVHGIVLGHLLPILDERGVHPSTAILAASMIGPMQVAGRLAVMATESRLPSAPMAVACLVGMSLASLALIGAAAVPLLVAFVVLQGACYGTSAILRPVVVAERLGRDGIGAVIGLMAVPFIAASAVAPFLGTLLWRAGGYDGALIVTALLALAGAAALARGGLR